MPWTFAHAAAVLPFRKMRFLRLPLAALVTGSVAPDLGYYFGQFDLATRAHSLSSGLLISVPTGLFALVVCQFLGARVCHLLPQPHRRIVFDAFNERLFESVTAAMLTVLALAIGAATHTLWDSFTHVSGWFVVHSIFLQSPAPLSSTFSPPFYKLLQHLSTASGIAVLALAYAASMRRNATHSLAPAFSEQRWRFRLLVATCFLTAGLAALFVLSRYPSLSFGKFVFRYTLTATNIFASLVICAALIHRKRP